MKKDLKKVLQANWNQLEKEWNTVIFSQYPSITAYDDDDGEGEGNAVIGNIAEQYLRKFASKPGTDKTFGLRDMDGKFYIGNKKAKINENNIIIDEKKYAGTPRLWKLIVELLMIKF